MYHFYVQLLRILQEESLATAPLLLPGLMIQQGHDGYIREQKTASSHHYHRSFVGAKGMERESLGGED